MTVHVKCMYCQLEQDLDINPNFRPKGFSCISCSFRSELQMIRLFMADHGIVEFTIKVDPEELAETESLR